jgi:diguanylate cyclase (GGDEF)-like protein
MNVKTQDKPRVTTKRVTRATIKREDVFSQVFNTSVDAIVLSDSEGVIKLVNPKAEQFFNLTSSEMIGRKMQFFCEINGTNEVNILRPGKDPGIAEIRCVEFKLNGSQSIYVSNFRDITEMVRLREELRALALLDDCVDLCNRRGFIMLAQQQLKLVERSKKGLYLLMVKLDNYKQVLAIQGQQASNKLLVKFAEILKDTFRKSDIIARVSDDTFAVLAIEAREDSNDVMASHLLNQLGQYNAKAGVDGCKLLASLGTAYHYPDRPCGLEELLQQAGLQIAGNKRGKQESALLWYLWQTKKAQNN